MFQTSTFSFKLWTLDSSSDQCGGSEFFGIEYRRVGVWLSSLGEEKEDLFGSNPVTSQFHLLLLFSAIFNNNKKNPNCNPDLGANHAGRQWGNLRFEEAKAFKSFWIYYLLIPFFPVCLSEIYKNNNRKK